jgi:hypothetical protein
MEWDGLILWSAVLIWPACFWFAGIVPILMLRKKIRSGG